MYKNAQRMEDTTIWYTTGQTSLVQNILIDFLVQNGSFSIVYINTKQELLLPLFLSWQSWTFILEPRIYHDNHGSLSNWLFIISVNHIVLKNIIMILQQFIIYVIAIDIKSYHDNNESISIHNLGNCAARSHCFGKLFNVLQTGDLSATATPSLFLS